MIAYESSLIAVSALIFLNVFSLLILLFNIQANWIETLEHNYGKTIKLIAGLLLVLPQYFILRVVFKKDHIIAKQKEMRQVRTANKFLVLYVLLSIAFLIYCVKAK